MKHTIALNPKGLIEIKYVGTVDPDDNLVLIKKSYDMTIKLIDEGKPAAILVNLTETLHIDPGVLGLSVPAIRDGEFKKLAAYGLTDPQDKELLLTLVNDPEARDKAKYFDTREQAEAWLLE